MSADASDERLEENKVDSIPFPTSHASSLSDSLTDIELEQLESKVRKYERRISKVATKVENAVLASDATTKSGVSLLRRLREELSMANFFYSVRLMRLFEYKLANVRAIIIKKTRL